MIRHATASLWRSTATLVSRDTLMRCGLKRKGDAIARLIKQHGGWIEGEHVRFPTPHAMAQFFKALDADKTNDT
jgi:hypothetical protein